MKFVDIQVNGAFGVDFNDEHLELEQFEFACERLAACGVEHFFPTIITAPFEVMCERIHTLAQWVQSNPSLSKWVAGIHIEGPFISRCPGYRGTHPLPSIEYATLSRIQPLVEAGNGLVKMVTLAPEMDQGGETVSWLTRQEVVVFAGHTDASLDNLRQSIDCGLRGFTHFGNGCAMEIARHDNVLNRVIACRKDLIVSMIADDIHVPLWLLKAWIEIFGDENVIITSDSMSAAGMPAGEYCIGGQPILVDENRRTIHRDHAYLAGSASTLWDMSALWDRHLAGSGIDKQRVFADNAKRLFCLS